MRRHGISTGSENVESTVDLSTTVASPFGMCLPQEIHGRAARAPQFSTTEVQFPMLAAMSLIWTQLWVPMDGLSQRKA